jgi:hypothetical protein
MKNAMLIKTSGAYRCHDLDESRTVINIFPSQEAGSIRSNLKIFLIYLVR